HVGFYRQGQFNPESNLLFGEGGAGAYSDGKLHTRRNDPRTEKILTVLYDSGADPEALLDGKPHLGSDKLPGICKRIRRRIEALGGQVRFGCRVIDLLRDQAGAIASVRLADGSEIRTDVVILAIGHSARDMYKLLHSHRIALAPKPFQMGVRIQHPQELIDRWQYGTLAGHPKLPPADYRLVAKRAAGRLGDVFSFCMCPGGAILPANESANLIVTNGASAAGRSGQSANSGLVVSVPPDVFGTDPLAGIEFQEYWEQAAFTLSGSYAVPAQRATDFLAGSKSTGPLSVDHPIGHVATDIRPLLPRQIAKAIGRALRMMGRRLRGFAGADAIITAPETRASSPVRIVRNAETRCSVSATNLYPIGEGAGYAGGIMSAAIDGLKTAEAIITRCKPISS
ncbi:unnamed protein product, partial [marine sediment metagenome]